jgi:hypothetical protein
MVSLIIFCSSRRQQVTTSSEFLVDNPIYKTSTASLIHTSQNGLRGNSRNRTLKSVGSEVNCDGSLSPCNSTCKLAADNPQYGSGLHPPPTHKPPRYIKVNAGSEPTYELIQGSESSTDGSTARVDTLSVISRGSGEVEPVYCTPSTAKKDLSVPLYESTMDIPIAVGAGGEYAKLNHST